MRRLAISMLWILSGMHFVFDGCMTYWYYSRPLIVYVGMIPELFPIGHIYIGIMSIVVGVKLIMAPSKAGSALLSFCFVLPAFIIFIFGRELFIYQMWIANDYMWSELLLCFYAVLIFAAFWYLKSIGTDLKWKWYVSDVESIYAIPGFAVAMFLLPPLLRYHYFEFLHGS